MVRSFLMPFLGAAVLVCTSCDMHAAATPNAQHVVTAVGAGILGLAGICYIGNEIRWACADYLPLDRAQKALEASLSAEVRDKQKVKGMLQGLETSIAGVTFVKADAAYQDKNVAYFVKKEDIQQLLAHHKPGIIYNYIRSLPQTGHVAGVSYTDMSYLTVNQSGATCGFHAMHNGLYMKKLFDLYDTQAVDLLNFTQAYEDLKRGVAVEDMRTLMRTAIAAGDISHDNWSAASQDNIDDRAIEYIMKYAYGAQSGGMKAVDYTIMPNTLDFKPAQDGHFGSIIKKLQNKEDMKIHLFLLGNMRDTFSVGGSGGHWTSVVAVKRSEQNLHLMLADSLGSRFTQMPVVYKLAEFLQLDAQEVSLAPLTDMVAHAWASHGRKSYAACLGLLDGIEELAKEKELFDKDLFKFRCVGDIENMRKLCLQGLSLQDSCIGGDAASSSVTTEHQVLMQGQQ